MGRQGVRRAVLALAVSGLAGCAGQCGARGGLPPPRPPTVKGPDGTVYHLVDKGAYKAFYDRWGRLQRIEYDSNGDGRADHVARHDGRKHAYQVDVDLDFDGRPDRWERYDDEGRLLKVGTASGPGRAPDRWEVAGPDGSAARREHDADGDGVPERVEILDAGRVAEVQIDSDRNGRIDRWQKWEAGRLAQEDLDTDGDGRGDRRLRYDARGKLLGVEPVAPAR
jgi:hypothetical protein